MNTTTPLSEVVYRDGQSFKILDSDIVLYSEKMAYGYNTVAELDGKLHYLGGEFSNLTTAIFAWEYIHGRLLTKEEMRQVLVEHNII
jgi:hypothetical protein